jgi:hypothetical protein
MLLKVPLSGTLLGVPQGCLLGVHLGAIALLGALLWAQLGAHLEMLPGDRLGEMLGALHGVLLGALPGDRLGAMLGALHGAPMGMLLGSLLQVMAMRLDKSWGAP